MTDDQTRHPHPVSPEPASPEPASPDSASPDPARLGPSNAAAGSPGPEPGETQLRKVLAMTNDLEPPRDDLFAQRALQRGRARTARRRNLLVGAAAGLVVVGLTGATWAALRGTTGSTSAGSAASAQLESGQDRAGSQAASPGVAGPSVPAARDASPFFGTLATPATAAFETIEPTLVERWPDVFAGAYADDASGTRVVVTVTRHDSDLEAYVTAAMPAGAVRFAPATHTWVAKEGLVAQVRADVPAWAADGVRILDAYIDSRADRVVVVADEGGKPGRIADRYGDLVRVVAVSAEPTLPDGGTLPTLQR